ncbi:hypothetical protein [Streptomyces sp. NPDC052107]|uniref:hypothetical protein n=1 Tax=Streptomyces sp. NPDC052107 TaxID=3155632 RepID=UPI00343D5DD0
MCRLVLFLRLLAGGFGSREATTSHEPGWTPRHKPELAALAERFAANRQQSATAVIGQAAARECADFDDTIMELCR